MPSPTDASVVEPIKLSGRPGNPSPDKTMVFQHGRLTIRVTCNEPSPAAAESFRSALYQLIMRLIDPNSTL